MEWQSSSDMDYSILNNVKEGMEVYDLSGNKIGEVEDIQYGAVNESAEDRGEGAAAPAGGRELGGGIYDAIEDVFNPGDNLNDTVKGRLWRSGFVRIDGPGLADEDHYVTPDQIESVSGNAVHLKIDIS